MKKVFAKIAALSVGLTVAIGVGVASGSKAVAFARADDAPIMTFDFEDETAHRTSGSNTYSSTPNVYQENGVDITLTYADSVTTGTPLSGSANIIGRVGKNTKNSPLIVVGPIDLSSYSVSGYSYNTKSIGTLTVTSSYSLDGTSYTEGESHSGNSSAKVFAVDELSIVEQSTVYFKFEVTITNGNSTSSNRDTQIDDIKIIGHSTSSKPLESISCDSQSINVAESLDLASKITFTPSDAANKNVNFSIKENNGVIDLSSTGVVTGLKGGSAVVTITPEDTSAGATAIDVAITVNSIPAPALTVGDQYVIYAVDSANSYSGELSGIANNLGTVAQMSGDVPACEYVLTTEDGFFENTVALSDGNKYLSLNAAGNNLHTSAEITPNSSWIVSVDDEVLHIVNTAFQNREIRFNYNSGSPRFACYTLGGQTAISLYHFEEKALVDFSIQSEIEVYVSGSAEIQVTYDPADAIDKQLTWTSEDESIATVDNGVVTGVAVGDVEITASKTIGDTLVERTCTVHVLNNAASHHGTQADPFDVEDAVNVAKGIFVKDPDGNDLSATGTYYVYGLVTATATKTKSNLSIWVGDHESQTSAATGAFEIYKAAKVYGVALADAYATDDDVKVDFNVGNHVLFVGEFTYYNNTTSETKQGTADIIYSDYIEARKYATAFNAAFEAEGVCDEEGKSVVATLASVWGTQSTSFQGLDDDTKAILTGAEPSSKASATAVEKCAAKYDYIGGKYQTQLGAEYDFMGRKPSPVSGGAIQRFDMSEDNNTMVIVISVAAISALAFTTLLVFKKKRQK